MWIVWIVHSTSMSHEPTESVSHLPEHGHLLNSPFNEMMTKLGRVWFPTFHSWMKHTSVCVGVLCSTNCAPAVQNVQGFAGRQPLYLCVFVGLMWTSGSVILSESGSQWSTTALFCERNAAFAVIAVVDWLAHTAVSFFIYTWMNDTLVVNEGI